MKFFRTVVIILIFLFPSSNILANVTHIDDQTFQDGGSGSNFLTGIDWMVISPFFLLIYYISVKSFSNNNIIPLVISGLSYDIFLSENYLGVYSILFLIVAIVSNYIQKKVQSVSYQEFLSFTFGFLIYNTINLLEIDFVSFFISSLLINYLIYFFYQRTLGNRV